MSDPEQWETPEKIDAARRELAAAIPGWRPPAAHGTVLVPADRVGTAEVTFPVVNVGAHVLPALAMATVTGHVDETATYEISPAQLSEAVRLIAPAEAARMYRHPNLAAWRAMLDQLPTMPDACVFVVFVGALDDPISSPYDQALRTQIASGERAELYA